MLKYLFSCLVKLFCFVLTNHLTFTDNFNAYLALSNFSNFTTNRWCTPNTRFFMFFFQNWEEKKPGNWRFSKLKGKKTCNWYTCNWCICTHCTHEKTCIWCTPSICCEIRKIGQRQIGVKIISVGSHHSLDKNVNGLC